MRAPLMHVELVALGLFTSPTRSTRPMFAKSAHHQERGSQRRGHQSLMAHRVARIVLALLVCVRLLQAASLAEHPTHLEQPTPATRVKCACQLHPQAHGHLCLTGCRAVLVKCARQVHAARSATSAMRLFHQAQTAVTCARLASPRRSQQIIPTSPTACRAALGKCAGQARAVRSASSVPAAR